MNTLKEEIATWDYVANICIEENMSLKNTARNTRGNPGNETASLGFAVRGTSRRGQLVRTDRARANVRCF